MLTLILDLLFPPNGQTLLARKATPEVLAKLLAPRMREKHTLALFPFGDPMVRALVHEMKYRGSYTAPRLLAQTAIPAIAEYLAEKQVFESFRNTLLIPLPLHPRKERERGFNQSERLARALVAEGFFSKNALAPRALARHRHTESQTLMHSTRTRRENIRDAFRSSDPALIAGRDIILLDDVTTSGATLAEARRTLMKGGASEVLCIAIAYA